MDFHLERNLADLNNTHQKLKLTIKSVPTVMEL